MAVCSETYMAVCDEVQALRQQLEQAEARVAELEERAVPVENGKNRYGLDMAYFRRLFNRELCRPLYDYMPHELARVLARASRAANPAVLLEPEFQDGGSAWLLRKQAEAVEEFAAYLDSAGNVVERNRAEDYAQRLHQQADELEQ